MRFEKIRPGEYRARRGSFFIWVVREAPRTWRWYMGGYDAINNVWVGDNSGKFSTSRDAMASAIANYELNCSTKPIP
jgi:hypothetical protein